MRRHAIRSPHAASRGGFTLVEMLVATTLVVLMMLMFAQIYTAAIRSVSDQQSIARNDQRARSVDQVLRNDLLRTSFREVSGSRGIVPLVDGDAVHFRQKGYFYISENDRDNPLDDVLQFTMLVAPDSRSKDNTPFYGRCIRAELRSPALPPEGLDVQFRNGNTSLINHPDEDDGIEGNSIGYSRGAEVAYFVRQGKLYRRVLLLRDPAQDASDMGAQPRTYTGDSFTGEAVAKASSSPNADLRGCYHQRFDYCAYWDASTTSVRFLGLDALDNYGDTSTTFSLGRSQYRYGFRFNGGTGVSGKPVEYASGRFFGRMTHAETNSRYNAWPGGVRYIDVSNTPVPLFSPNPIESGALTLDPATNQLSASGNLLHNTIRANEDLLMNNVEAFDIEVWDPALATYVQLGQPTIATAIFGEADRTNRYYGPLFYTHPANPGDPHPASNNWVFDTGHPNQWSASPIFKSEDKNGNGALDLSEDTNGNKVLDPGEDLNSNGVLDPAEDVNGNTVIDVTHAWREDNKAPFRPLRYRFSEDSNNDNNLDPGEDLNINGVLDKPAGSRPYRIVGGTYPAGSIVFRPGDVSLSIAYRAVRSGEDANGNGNLDAGEDLNSSGTLDNGTTSPSNPPWSVVPGTQIQDGGVTWEAFDNRIGLESIRVTVRTRDTATGNPRQITILHSFVEPPVGQ